MEVEGADTTSAAGQNIVTMGYPMRRAAKSDATVGGQIWMAKLGEGGGASENKSQVDRFAAGFESRALGQNLGEGVGHPPTSPTDCSQITPSRQAEKPPSWRTLPCSTRLFTIQMVHDRLSYSTLRQGIHRQPANRLPSRGTGGLL